MANKVLFVGHDANRAGAQLVLLHWIKAEAARGNKPYLLLARGGVLLKTYQKYAQVWVWEKGPSQLAKWVKKIPLLKREERINREPGIAEIKRLIARLQREKFDLILGNTVASLGLMQQLRLLNASFEAYIHELDFSLKMYASKEDMAFLRNDCRRVYAVSAQVQQVLQETYSVPQGNLAILPPIVELPKQQQDRGQEQRKSLGIPANAPVVFGCGLAEWRKGTDIFVRVAKQLIAKHADLHMVWVGVGNEPFSADLKAEKVKWDTENRLHLVPTQADPKPYFDMADLFFLSSREDPFPLVMLEAGYAATPIIGFKGAGGVNDFLAAHPELLVEYTDEAHAANKIETVLAWPLAERKALGLKLKEKALGYSATNFIQRFSELNEQ
jgi:glycosyltransferase involved in cell wall biosynthesis